MAWMKVSAARDALNGAVSVQTLYSLLEKGELLGTKIGGVILVDSDSLAELVSQGTVDVRVRKRERTAKGKLTRR